MEVNRLTSVFLPSAASAATGASVPAASASASVTSTDTGAGDTGTGEQLNKSVDYGHTSVKKVPPVIRKKETGKTWVFKALVCQGHCADYHRMFTCSNASVD